MPIRPTLAAIALLLVTLPAGAAENTRALKAKTAPPAITLDRTDEQGVVSGGRTVSTTANVKKVDLDKREVTLRLADGKVETIQAGPEVTNLEKIDVGDRVTIRYREGLVLRVQAPGAEDVAPEIAKKVEKTGVGDVLGGTETVRARETLSIAAIDAAARAVTLQGPDGKTYVVKAGPKVDLARVKVGDKFTATYSSATAVSVQPVQRR
jgi:Cu/Ag efflux protein CusF